MCCSGQQASASFCFRCWASLCHNKRGSCKPWVGKRFFEMNISLTFYRDLSQVRSVQPHLLGPKIVFSCWSFLRLDSFFSEKGILPTHGLPSPTSSEINTSSLALVSEVPVGDNQGPGDRPLCPVHMSGLSPKSANTEAQCQASGI